MDIPPATLSALDGWIDICRTGTWTDMHGQEVEIDEARLDRIVEAYGTADAAPAVVGHPADDAPAYGWVDKVRRVGDRLQMTLRDIMPAFRTAVEEGRYTGRSIAVGKDDVLVHVGFLGGRAPAVPGLSPTQFSSSPDRVIVLGAAELGSYNPMKWMLKSVARSLRNMREYILARDGEEAADKVVPNWEIDNLNEAIEEMADDLEDRGHGFAAPVPGNPSATDPDEVPMPDNQPTQAELDAQAAELKAGQDRLAAGQRQLARQVALQAADAVLEVHVQAGRVLPGEKPGLAALLASLPDGEGDTVLRFSAPSGENGAHQDVSQKPRELLENFLAALPERVNYRELAGGAMPAQAQTGQADTMAVTAKARELLADAQDRGISMTVTQAVDRARVELGVTEEN